MTEKETGGSHLPEHKCLFDCLPSADTQKGVVFCSNCSIYASQCMNAHMYKCSRNAIRCLPSEVEQCLTYTCNLLGKLRKQSKFTPIEHKGGSTRQAMSCEYSSIESTLLMERGGETECSAKL